MLEDRHGVLKGFQWAKRGATRGPRYTMTKGCKSLTQAGVHVHRDIKTHKEKRKSLLTEKDN